MNDDIISVIIPVYNVEKYIKKNVESLLNQSYSNFEIIYVDDGSKDNSLDILNEYKLKDSRIKVVHTDNYGVSHCRNVGIELAIGEYITFIDGDDYVDEDYLEYLISLIKLNNVGMAISLGHHLNDDLEQPITIYNDLKNSLDIIEDIYLNRIYMAVWNKIYRRSLIVENNIRFDESLWYAEGMHFNIQCLSCIEKIIVGNKRVYHYISNPNSAMRKGFNIENEKCALKSLDLQRNLLIKKNIINCNALEFHYMMIEYMLYSGIMKNKLGSNKEIEIKKIIKEIKNRKNIPWKVDLNLKDKIKWILIGNFPKIMTKISIIKNK